MKLSKGIIAMGLFALFWNGLVVKFEGAIGGAWWSQRDAAERFVPAEATVLESIVKKSRTEDGYRYKPFIRYRYEFEGETFESDRYAFMVIGTPDHVLANGIQSACPVGQTVTAFVDPTSPDSAVLNVAGNMIPSSLILVLAPFQSMGLVLLSLLIGMIRASRFDDKVRAKYVRVDTPDHLVLGRRPMASLGVFAISMSLLTLCALGIVLFTWGIDAPAPVLGTSLGLCVTISGGLTWWRRARSKRPENFVHINRQTRTFAFPADSPGTPIDSVRSILVDPRSTGTIINGVAQVDHRFQVETDDGVLGLFRARGGEEEGNKVLDLLRAELM